MDVPVTGSSASSSPAVAPPEPGPGSSDVALRDLEALLAAPAGTVDPHLLYEAALVVHKVCGLEQASLLATAMQVAAERGVADAWIDLGHCRWNGWGVPRDPEAALADFLRGADEGSVEGAFVAAHHLYRTFGRPDDAARYVSLALERGDFNGRARFLAGLMAWQGHGRPRDPEEAMRLFHESAGEGNPDAMFIVADLYGRGDGVEKDPVKALVWCRRAAEQSHPEACYRMGAFHATGHHGARQDMGEAVGWYARASSAGHGRASFTLGVMYLYGEGVDQDLERARHYLEQAARQGLDRPELAEAMEELEGFEAQEPSQG